MLPTEDLFVYLYMLIHDAIMAGAIAVPPRPGPAPACTDAELLTIAMARHLLGRRSEAGFLAEVTRDWGHLFPLLPHQSEANRRIRWLRGAFEQFRALVAGAAPRGDFPPSGPTPVPRHPPPPAPRAGPPPRDLLADKGFNGRASPAGQAARGTAVLVPPGKNQRHSMPAVLQKIIAEWRNRIETTFGEITAQMELARHGAHTFCGLLTRTAPTIP